MTTARQRLRASTAIAVTAVLAAVVSAPVARAAPAPAPVSDVATFVFPFGQIQVQWRLSPDTRSAVVCYRTDGVSPATPGDPATCSPPRTVPSSIDVTPTSTWFYDLDARNAVTYSISVFAYDATSGTCSPPTSTSVVGVRRPGAPFWLRTEARGAHDLQLWWAPGDAWGSTPVDALVAWRRGVNAPAADEVRAVVHCGGGDYDQPCSLHVTGLVPDAVYTFSVRQRDAVGVVGPPTTVQAATRVAGLTIATAHGRHRLAVPVDAGATAAMSPTGTVEAAATRLMFTTGWGDEPEGWWTFW